MFNIIGQNRLRAKLDSYTIKTMPKTMLFLGPSGCGKTLFARELADRLSLDFKEIDENVTREQLVDYLQSPIDTLYLIDLTKFSENKQNQFLKFIEEPSSTVFIILEAENEAGILNTVLNRSLKYYFEEYTVEELKKFAWLDTVDDESIFEIYKTPGSICDLSINRFKKLRALCENILNYCTVMPYANAINISNFINLKNDFDKYEIDEFFSTLAYLALEKYKKEDCEAAFKVYEVVTKFKQEKMNKNIVKESFILNFLNSLYLEVRANDIRRTSK